jgi:hypothetical protein
MIHNAKDLSPDQKTLIEGLLGRSVSEDEAISIRTMGSGSAPEWLQASWESAKRAGVYQLSMDEIDAEIVAYRRERRTRGAMIRVVLDTNILASALLTPQGLPAQVLSLCVTDRDLEIVDKQNSGR